MKRILFTAVSLGVLGLMSPALAADLTPYMKAPPVAPAVYDWSGFYVGVFGGGGLGNHNLNNANGVAGFANFTINYDSTGGVAGGEAGYYAQSGNLVFGVEANGFWSGIKGNDLSQQLGFVDASNLRWGTSVVAKGGVAIDRILLYVDGGWAHGDIRHASTNFGFPVDTFTNDRNGLTAGGGMAFAFTNNLIGRFDYRYYNLGRYIRPGNPLTPNGLLPYTIDNTYSVVTLGLDYKFGGAVVAKY
jgi:outer membrane immunogenic protein